MTFQEFTGASTPCTCDNPKYGFDCSCKCESEHPGGVQYSCEFCGLYTAGAPKCDKCEED